MALKLPKPASTESVEREYFRFLDRYAEAYVRFMREGLDEIVPVLKGVAGDELPRADSVRMDANIDQRIAKLIEFVEHKLEVLFPDSVLSRWASAMVGGVNRLAKRNMSKSLMAAYRKTKKGRRAESPPDFEPLMHDGALSPYFKNIVEENVGLIRSIPTLKLPAFKNQLVALITQDATQATIRDAIMKNFDLTRGRASLIARDQTAKLNGALTKYRQQQIGGKRYFWRRTKDRRCRESHRKLGERSDRGETFSWSKPPIADASGKRGHPGELWQCRCWAEMDFSDVLR